MNNIREKIRNIFLRHLRGNNGSHIVVGKYLDGVTVRGHPTLTSTRIWRVL